MRGSGSYVNPDDFAGLIELVLPLAMAYTVMGRMSATLKVLLGYASLVMLTGLVVAKSRGGALATVATLALFCVILLYQEDYWKRGLVAALLLAVAGGALLYQFSGLMERFNDGGLFGKGDGRKLYWFVAERLFHQHPLWGIGPGLFRYEFLGYTTDWGQVGPQLRCITIT